jgi:hypothetical protein
MMQQTKLDYPEDIELVFRNGRLSSLQILDSGWKKLEAKGWPAKGPAMPINITLEQVNGDLSVTVAPLKN